MSKFEKIINSRKKFTATFNAEGIHYELKYRICRRILGRYINTWVTIAEMNGNSDFGQVKPLLETKAELLFASKRITRKTRTNPFIKNEDHE